jgi:hypothetical protein
MSLYDNMKAAIDNIIADYKAANTDGKLTFTEIFTLVSNAVATFVQLLENFGGGTGAEKKAVVLQAIEQFFDEVIIPIDIKGIPNVLEGIVGRALKQLVLSLADGWIDSIVNIFNKTGWGVPGGSPTGDPENPLGDIPGTPGIPPGFEAY